MYTSKLLEGSSLSAHLPDVGGTQNGHVREPVFTPNSTIGWPQRIENRNFKIFVFYITNNIIGPEPYFEGFNSIINYLIFATLLTYYFIFYIEAYPKGRKLD